MSLASRSVNAAYIRSALDVKAQRNEVLALLCEFVGGYTFTARDYSELHVAHATLKEARAIIRKAKKWK